MAQGREPASKTARVYIGSYANETSDGIHLLELDLESGKLTRLGGASGAANPSFLALHPNGKFLYAVCEVADFDNGKGAVAAFAIDGQGGLKLLNRESSGGAGPCHLVVDREGKNVLAANYSGGSVCVLPIDHKGHLAKASSFIQHEGKGVDPGRQEGPHAHSINLDRDNHYAFVADLGLDEVLVYHFDPIHGKLTPHKPPFARVAPGAGPRHFSFHPNGRYAYVNNEMASTVTAFEYDAHHGTLKEVQTITTLPDGFKGDNNSTAEVRVHPSGKTLYCSNRGHDSVAIFSLDPDTGRLTAAGHQSTKGKTPRNFGIDPSGGYLLAANQDSDNVVVFKIADDGGLSPTGHEVKVPKPVCVKFVTH